MSGLASTVQVLQGPGPRPRAAILTKNVNLWYCPSLSDKDSVTAVGYIGKKKTYFNSTYCDGGVFDVPEALKHTVDKSRIGNGLLIGMDLNAHSLTWDWKEDVRGDMLHDFITKNNLNLENEGKTRVA